MVFTRINNSEDHLDVIQKLKRLKTNNFCVVLEGETLEMLKWLDILSEFY